MELLKAVELADKLCPNQYTREEKLYWCYELSAIIRREIKKVYDVVTTHIADTGEIIIPDEISFDDIEAAYVNGEYMSKLDFRSFTAQPSEKLDTATVKLVYLTKAEPLRNICLSGEFDLSESFISMLAPPFAAGDTLEYIITDDLTHDPDWDSCERCHVMESVYDGLLTDEAVFTPQSGAKMHIRRVIDNLTETDGSAYDNIYIEYILAKEALYRHDYTGYNAHISLYNTMYDALRRDYKSRAPLNKLSVFKNYQ